MTEDVHLLRRYVEARSEEAFAELVRRRVDLVYSVALRHTCDRQRAEDVTQTVFTALARRADTLLGRPTLVGWLHRSAQYAASDLVRSEVRRQAREQEAYNMDQLARQLPDPDWNEAQPVLDEVLNDLSTVDRDAVLLRFHDGRTFGEIAEALRLTESGARMRVARALEKMRVVLERRGVSSSAAALGAAFATKAGVAAPAGLAAAVTMAALAATPAAVGAAGITTLMTITKTQIAVVTGLAVAGIFGVVGQARAIATLRDEVATVRHNEELTSRLREQNAALARGRDTWEALRAQAAEVGRLKAQLADLRSHDVAPSVVGRREGSVSSRTSAPFDGRVFELSQVDAQPKAISRIAPIYPADLRKLQIGGRATVEFVVTPSGKVQNATVQDTTNPEIGEAALEAVRQWEFEPAQKSGEAVAVRTRVPIIFKVDPIPVDGSSRGKSVPAFVPWF